MVVLSFLMLYFCNCPYLVLAIANELFLPVEKGQEFIWFYARKGRKEQGGILLKRFYFIERI